MPDDPIYAAIETDRKLNAEFIRLCDAEDALEESGIELVPAPDDSCTPEMVAAVDAAVNARRSLAKTVPTTPAGLAAYLDYLLTGTFALDGEFYFDGKDETGDFLQSIHRAVHGMSGLRPMQMPLAVTDTSADADLVALEAKIMAVAHEAEISGPAFNRAEAVYFAWRRKNPEPESPDDLARWNARRDAKKVACRYDEKKAKWYAHCSELDELTEEIAGTPAKTKEGIKIKRRIARYRSDFLDLDGVEGVITASIKRDIRMQRKLAAVS
jgi:hypothetical protein